MTPAPNMTRAQAIDAAEFYAEEGWLPPAYAGKLVRWAEGYVVPRDLSYHFVRIHSLDFSQTPARGRARLLKWVRDTQIKVRT